MAPEVVGPFVVACLTCARTLMVVPRIGDAEVAVVARHLRACDPGAALGDTPSLAQVLRRVRVGSVAAGSDDRARGKS